MIVKRGTIVESDFGYGPVVAVTKSWLIHQTEDGTEVCIYIPDGGVSIRAEFDGAVDVPDSEVELS